MNRSIVGTVLVYGVCLFASWTVFCYAMVLTESGFSDLKTWCFVPVVVGLAIGTLCLDKYVASDVGSIVSVSGPMPTFGVRWEISWALLAMFITAMVLRVVDTPYWSVWIVLLCIAILVFRTVSTSVAKHSEPLMPGVKLQKVGAAALMVLGAILVAIVHRPDLDDAQYLNFVVTAMDFPSEPLFSHSGLWQDRSVPMELPIYRFHSYELLVAVLSDAFSVDHKTFYYLILAPIFGGVAVLVHWRLAQHLVPQHALSMLLAWLVLTIALGESHREFGNFAFVRLYQGKAILVTVALPICLLLGLRLAESPTWRRALALGMAVIASLGMSSSALAAVPFVVAAALSGGLLGASRASVRVIIVGGVASLFVLIAIGTVLVMMMHAGGNGIHGESIPSAGKGLSIVLGNGILGALVLASFPVAPLFVNGFRRRQLFATTTLIFVIVVLNPWTATFIAKMLDSALQWRLFWSVPLVISAAISLTGLAVIVTGKLPRAARYAVLSILLVAVLLASNQLSISPDNQVVITLPHYKMDPAAYAVAAGIARNAPPRSTIYAPISIAHLITTFRLHPYPLIVRPEYLGFERIRIHFGDAELDRRRRVINFLEGSDKDPSTAAFFQAQLASDRPAFVAYERYVEMAPVIAAELSAAGYIGKQRGIYWLWQRP